jgi:AcrR family transcriptional regulator
VHVGEIDMTLPPGVRASWGLTRPSARGRRPSIQLSDIVSAAIALADAEGLAAVSMPRVAGGLGLTQNALYRHVASKDELLVLIADAATGEPPELDGADWRDAARAWVSGVIARYLAHPWLLDIRLRAPVTRNTVLWTEAFLRATRGSGLPVDQRVQCALLLDGYARHTAALGRDLAGQGPAYGRTLVTTLVPLFEEHGCTEFAGFLRDAALRSDAPATDAVDDAAFGMERILDGIAALIPRQ